MYDMIFKRRSFHLFRDLGNEKLTAGDLEEIEAKYEALTPLFPEIKTKIRIVSSHEKTLGRGAEYAIEIYSETKEDYLMNVGYLGQQLDLYLVSRNIGTLWFGIGKPEEKEWEGLHFVIMILIARVDNEARFRKDMFKAKRKPVSEIWEGPEISGVTDIVRFAPSACNSQPWKVVNEGEKLSVYHVRRPGRSGIMPAAMGGYFNCIDVGIFLCFMDLCLTHEGIPYRHVIIGDSEDIRDSSKIMEYLLNDREPQKPAERSV